MTHEGSFEMFMSMIALLGLFVLIAIILWTVYQIADRAFLKERSSEGTIVGKWLARPHTSVTMQSHKVRYGNSWRLIISIDGNVAQISIGQGSIDEFQIGDQVLATYSIGRLSGNIRLFNIEKQDKEQ